MHDMHDMPIDGDENTRILELSLYSNKLKCYVCLDGDRGSRDSREDGSHRQEEDLICVCVHPQIQYPGQRNG